MGAEGGEQLDVKGQGEGRRSRGDRGRTGTDRDQGKHDMDEGQQQGHDGLLGEKFEKKTKQIAKHMVAKKRGSDYIFIEKLMPFWFFLIDKMKIKNYEFVRFCIKNIITKMEWRKTCK